MKIPYIPFVLLIFISVLLYSCSEHCDDEDYTRDQKDQAARVIIDSLKVNSVD